MKAAEDFIGARSHEGLTTAAPRNGGVAERPESLGAAVLLRLGADGIVMRFARTRLGSMRPPSARSSLGISTARFSQSIAFAGIPLCSRTS